MSGDNELDIRILAYELVVNVNSVIGGGNGGVACGGAVKGAVLVEIRVGGDDNSAVGIYLDELGVDDLDTRNYECWTYDTDSLSFDPDHFNGDNEFKELPLESGEWTHYSFEFTKPGIDGVKIQDDVIVVIGAEKFGVTVSRMPADFGEINIDKNEVLAAVQECVENEVRSGYKIEDVSLNESMMYLTTYKGRLCCVITEFIVDYTSKSDNSPYNMLLHDHCGAIVFLE